MSNSLVLSPHETVNQSIGKAMIGQAPLGSVIKRLLDMRCVRILDRLIERPLFGQSESILGEIEDRLFTDLPYGWSKRDK